MDSVNQSQGAADVLLETDSDLRIHFAAGATGALANARPEALIGSDFGELVVPEHRPLLVELARGMKAGTRLEPATIRLRGIDAPTPPLLLTGYHLPDLGGHYFFALRLRGAAVVEETATVLARDPETGLYERDSFATVAAQRSRDATKRGEKLKFTMVRIDELDALRTRLDHEAEENLLEMLGACLRASAIEGDSACRFDSTSYGLLHRGDLDTAGLARRFEAHARVADPRGQGVRVATSTVPARPADLTNPDSLSALMFALRPTVETEGRAILGTKGALDALIAETAGRMANFRRIAAGSDFEVAFQPIVEIGSRKIHHFEALARFGGNVEQSPYELITLAENTGIISDFDLAMCRKVLHWLEAAYDIGRRVRAAVYLSGHTIAIATVLDSLLSLLDKHPRVRAQLLFEITESARIRDIEGTNDAIQRLRRNGHRVCLDDFGSGAAALRYLQAFDVDIVKIDGHYIRSAATPGKNRAFLRAVATLCADLGIQTIAEMVETEDSLGIVHSCGIALAEGEPVEPTPVVAAQPAARTQRRGMQRG
ncbi:MAG: GGDEF domain-containing protein [Alphaproteobacteria bacterium]|nr:GGDEF domain-containing protein [Alphaproteobacteria bacterium]